MCFACMCTAGAEPFVGFQGLFEFRFQLVYTSLDEVLPRVQELWDVAQQSVSKESHQRAKQRLAAIIQVHAAACLHASSRIAL